MVRERVYRFTVPPFAQSGGQRMTCLAVRSPKLRKRRINPRKHRCLSELRNNPLRLGQMLKSERAFLLSFVEQSENHLHAAHHRPFRVVVRILQDGRCHGANA